MARPTRLDIEGGWYHAVNREAGYFGRNYSDKTLREPGELAGPMRYPAVTMAVRRLAKRLETDARLTGKLKHLRAMLLVKRRDPID